MRYNNIYFLIIPMVCFLWEPVLNAVKENKKAEVSKSRKSNRKYDVEVEYNVLDIHGQPANQIKQGENFSLSFSLINNSDDSLFLDNSFLNENTGFFMVYDELGNLIGTPMTFRGAVIVDAKAHPFYGGNKVYNLTVPWNDSRVNWTTLHRSFRGSNLKCLPKGKYHSIFKHRFCFDRNAEKPSLCLDPVSIRVDFEII